MSNTITLKKSGVAGNAPASGDLSLGEIALNYADGHLYYKSGASATPAKINAGDADTVDGFHLNQNVLTTSTPTFDKLRLTNGSDASLTSTDHAFQVGASSGQNLVIDNNEIVSRSNGTASTLYLQNDGGDVRLGSNGGTTRLFLQDGSAGAPAITFNNDANTGIYRSAADVLKIVTGGTTRATFNNTGIVSSLNLYSSSGGEFRNYGGTWQGTTGLTGNGFQFVNSVDGTALTISSTGDTVASGSITATSLDINGEANISDHLVVKGTSSSPLSSLFAGSLVVQGAGNEDSIIAVTDVNTTNAAAGVFHQSSTSPGFPALVINAASNGSEQPLISARTNVSNTSGIGGTEVFAVDGDGDATFAGDIVASGTMLVNGAEDNSGKADFAVSGGTVLSFRNNQVQMGGSDMNWNSKIFDDGQARWAAWDRNIEIFSTGSNTGSATARDIIFSPQTSGSAASTERMRIKGSGNVGIGTSSPSSKLHVNDTSVPSSGDLITSKIYSSGNVAANSNTRTGLDVETIRGGWFNSDSTSGNFKISSNNRIGDSDLIGVKSLATVDVNNVYSGVAAGGSLTAFYGKVSTTHTTGSGPVATAYGLRIDAPEVATDSEIGTYYGAYIDGASVSGTLTNKYALVTEASAGNVGIGTTSPAYRLHVSGAVGLTSSLYFTNNTAGIQVGGSWGNGVLNFRNGATNAITFDVPNNRIKNNLGKYLTASSGTGQFGTLDNQSVAIVANNSTKMTILSGGNVGIGITNPIADLHVNGDVQIGSSVSPNAYGALQVNQTSNVDEEGIAILSASAGRSMRIWVDETKSYINSGNGGSGDLILNEGAGNVGMGTTNPNYGLDISKDTGSLLNLHRPNSSTAAASTLDFSFNTANATEAVYARIRADVETNTDLGQGGDLSFHTANSGSVAEKMRITQEGNVGIGTATPSAPLEIAGAASATDTGITIKNGSATRLRLFHNDNAGASYLTSYDGVGAAQTLNIRSGNKLYLSGGGGATHMTITTSGEVGIGTTSPSSDTLIEINGNSYTRGKTRGIATNYATSEGWAASTAVSSGIGYFGGNFSSNGGSSENKIEYDIGPFGARELIWKTIPETGHNSDGGWNKSMDGFNNSAANGFISVVYVKRSSSTSAGTFYHGCSGSSTNNLDGTANTNPYFHSPAISNLPENVWCVAIGVIYAANDSNTTTSSLGGIYRLDTGVKISSSTTFRQKPSNTLQQQRVYHFYSTSPTAKLDFAKPAWYVVDGSEPTLSELTAGASGGDDVYWTANGNDIYNDNTGNVGIGTASPDQKLEVNGNAHLNYSLIGRGIRSSNRGELHLNATSTNDVSEIFFGHGDGHTEGNIRWAISDR
jgi:hypothetical protein